MSLMDWLWSGGERGQLNLVSIDTERGQLRAYSSVGGNAPKLVQTVDLANYDRGGFQWDVAAIEGFRQNPGGFITASGGCDAA